MTDNLESAENFEKNEKAGESMQHTFRKRIVGLLLGLLFLLLIGSTLYLGNNWIQISEYEVVSSDLPESFDGICMVQVSDLHNKLFGKGQKHLIAQLEKCEPDLIVITGDLVDSNRPHVENALLFVREAVKLAPVYFVTGNHDNWLSKEDTRRLYDGLSAAGVVVLDDEVHLLTTKGAKAEDYLYIAGLDDDTLADSSRLHETLTRLTADLPKTSFSLLLAHEPQLFSVYEQYAFDLVLSGHAHGGQFRIPLIGGFVAPDQGFFPKYTQGLSEEGDARMIISRGLGNSVVPIRLWNRPELVKIRLVKDY